MALRELHAGERCGVLAVRDGLRPTGGVCNVTTRVSAIALLGILALTALLYAPGLNVYFVADDFRYLELTRQTATPLDILSHISGACTRVGWPVVVFVFWLGRVLGGEQPEAYRLLSLAVHLANALLMFVLARRAAGGAVLPALAAALVLALHPRQHEAVMWLSTLTWAIGVSFSLAAAICYVTWRQTGAARWLPAVVALTVLAMVSSPATIVLPLLLAAFDVLRGSVQRSTVAACVGLLALTGALGLVCGLGSLPGGERASYGLALSGFRSAGLFLAYIVWPVPLDLREIVTATPLPGYAAAALSAGVVGLAGLLVLLRGNVTARWGALWVLLGGVPPAFFSSYTSDHYMSLMLAGVALACAGMLQMLPRRWLRLAVVALTIWAGLAVPQITIKLRDWQAAGAITSAVRDETLARVPDPANGTRFYYIGLPHMRNRTMVWSYGIDSAVRLWYNNDTLRAVRAVQFGVAREPLPDDVTLDFSGRWQ